MLGDMPPQIVSVVQGVPPPRFSTGRCPQCNGHRLEGAKRLPPPFRFCRSFYRAYTDWSRTPMTTHGTLAEPCTHPATLPNLITRTETV